MDELEAQHLGDEVALDLRAHRYLTAVYEELHGKLALSQLFSHVTDLHGVHVGTHEHLFLTRPPWTQVGRHCFFCLLHCMVPFFQSV